MLNRVEIIGTLGRDPESRSTQSGAKIVNLSVATSERWKDKSTGERREQTEWHRVTAFGPIADIAERYLRKGSKCYLSGQLKTRKWQDQSGQDRFTTEVVLSGPRAELTLLDPKKGGEGASAAITNRGDDLDDEIPF